MQDRKIPFLQSLSGRRFLLTCVKIVTLSLFGVLYFLVEMGLLISPRKEQSSTVKINFLRTSASQNKSMSGKLLTHITKDLFFVNVRAEGKHLFTFLTFLLWGIWLKLSSKHKGWKKFNEFKTDGKHFEKGDFRKRWRHDNHETRDQVFLKNKSKMIAFINSSGEVWKRKLIWCVFRVKPPFSNPPGRCGQCISSTLVFL